MKEIMVLGGGVYQDAEGDWHLGDPSRDRVDRALALLADSPAMDVVLSGGYGGASRGEMMLAGRPSEAHLMADYLTQQGYGANIAGLEEDSYSTVTNFTNSWRAGLLTDNAREPGYLGLITHPNHMNRAYDVAKILGLPMERCATPEQDDKWAERRLRGLYKIAFVGIAHASGDTMSRAVQMERRELFVLNKLLRRNIKPIVSPE